MCIGTLFYNILYTGESNCNITLVIADGDKIVGYDLKSNSTIHSSIEIDRLRSIGADSNEGLVFCSDWISNLYKINHMRYVEVIATKNTSGE